MLWNHTLYATIQERQDMTRHIFYFFSHKRVQRESCCNGVFSLNMTSKIKWSHVEIKNEIWADSSFKQILILNFGIRLFVVRTGVLYICHIIRYDVLMARTDEIRSEVFGLVPHIQHQDLIKTQLIVVLLCQ